jgi:hypothetical protein
MFNKRTTLLAVLVLLGCLMLKADAKQSEVESQEDEVNEFC